MNFFAAAANMARDHPDFDWPVANEPDRGPLLRNQGVSFMKGANAPAKYVTASSITSNS